MAHGKILLKGTVELCSPTLIGSGRNDESDIDVLLDADNNTPFIPATSLLGVLKHQIQLDGQHQDDLKRFWGFTSKEKISEKEPEKQSSIRCSDLYPQNSPRISFRDGIKIDHQSGMVAEGAKYDYQIIERGAKFALNIEVDYSKDNQPFIYSMLATICDLLEKEQVRVGAKTNNGLGKIKLIQKQVYKYDFSEKDDVLKWLKREFPEPFQISEQPLPLKRPACFEIEATFDLKHSLIVRSYPSSPELPDAVNVKSGGEYVLPGSSLKGAIRARAERILRTLRKPDEEDVIESMLTGLFGNVDEQNHSSNSKKGKIKVEETLLLKFISELHHRIKIDRFTGSTIEAALFDTVPVYPNLNDKVLEVKLTVRDYKPYEAGLLLLVLKDLWTGDLAVGGEKSIGRGVFEGCRAKVYLKNRETPILIEDNFSIQAEPEKEELESLVKALNDYQPEREGGREHEHRE